MSQLGVQFEKDDSAYKPGTLLRGTGRWHLDQQVRAIEVRLCWFTRGIGIPEAREVEKITIDRPGLEGSHSFQFRLPQAPLSYMGALSSLFWAVEVVTLPRLECAHAVFCLSPSANPLLLAPPPAAGNHESD